jgi:ABC-type branched-subunit amino acid transport system ATPase component/predicted MFS family arabinose efflux permease
VAVAGADIEAAGGAVTTVPPAIDEEPRTPAALARDVLDAEAERQTLHDAEAGQEVLFADDLLPGVHAEPMSLRQGLRVGGAFTFVVLLLLNSLDELESAALTVLAPEIRDSFGVSNGTILFIATAAGGFLVLGALPMGWLADRFRRGPVVGWASAVFGAMVLLSGLAINAFSLFWARFGVGVAKSNTLPVHGSLIADAYPIGVRARLSATTTGVGSVVGALSPALVGGIAALAGGDEGWRWPFLLLGLPVLALAFLAFRIPEPPRGQFEMLDVLGEVVDDASAAPISFEAGFARLQQIRTVKTVLVAFSAMGFGLFTGPILVNLYAEDRFGVDALERGLLGTMSGVVLLAVLPVVSRRYDELYRRDPARALRLVGQLIIPAGILAPVGYFMPNVVLMAVAGIPSGVLLAVAFSMVGPVMQSVVPYRLRGIGAALAAIYIFFIGATGGALLSALIVDAAGPRTTALLLGVPSTIIGGLLVVRSAGFIRHDLSLVVAELREELAEHRRRQAEPATVPAIQVKDVDFAYGPVQVLFDVAFEVRRGEVLALLGTNGAGKSTVLRVIAGLGTPSRGVVRLDGRTITYTTPEQRVHLGIRLLPGGKGVFPDMTVRENLEMGAFIYRGDPADRDRRIARVVEMFPDLERRHGQVAGSMSGGQQQMLALAITLLHDPEVLLIDELSLGLSPIVVQELLGVVERIKGEGKTIVIVEQSLNVALAIADRAVFMEKGQVRFEGPAADLAGRDDLVRAVFLGREGG